MSIGLGIYFFCLYCPIAIIYLIFTGFRDIDIETHKQYIFWLNCSIAITFMSGLLMIWVYFVVIAEIFGIQL